MRIFNKFRGTRGFVYVWERALRFRDMISAQALQRAKVLAFWERYGEAATTEAFGVSRPTLYRWQAGLRKAGGRLEGLNKKSTAPKRRRKRIVSDAVRDCILRERAFDPHISKDKLAVLLKEDGIAHLSPSTVGRILTDLKKRGVLPDPRPLSFWGKSGTHREKTECRRRKVRSKGHEGPLAKADTIVRFIDGTKRYIVTALDVESKFAFAYAYPSHSSAAAADFMRTFKMVAPVSLTHVQTDNGSEFAHHFDAVLDAEGIIHFHTYPRSPKQNAEIERFNRTLWEAFGRYHRHLLAHNLAEFNRKLIEWLLWYNARRPHWSLGLIPPLRYIVSKLQEPESQKCWTSTVH